MVNLNLLKDSKSMFQVVELIKPHRGEITLLCNPHDPCMIKSKKWTHLNSLVVCLRSLTGVTQSTKVYGNVVYIGSVLKIV